MVIFTPYIVVPCVMCNAIRLKIKLVGATKESCTKFFVTQCGKMAVRQRQKHVGIFEQHFGKQKIRHF